MSLILHPQNSFTVVRQIANHLDSATYYVRAVIRNAYTDATIDTLDLTSRGSQRFSKNWQVPVDTSGQGFYISIVTSVYTDSSYTTKSENYGDEETTYLVQDRVPLGRGAGAGGVDYFRLREIVKDELEKAKPKEPEPIQFPEIPKYEMRWDEILAAVKNIEVKAEKIDQKETDLSPVLDALNDVKQAVVDKEVTEATDLTPVLERLSDDKEDNGISMQEVNAKLDAMKVELEEAIASNIRTAISETEFTSTFATRAQPKKAAKSEEEPAIDPKQFAI